MDTTIVKMLFFFGIASFTGWLLIIGGIFTRRTQREREERERARATGTIVRYDNGPNGQDGNRPSAKPIVAFTADGHVFRQTYAVALNRSAHPVGEAVEVRYDADDPTHFHLELEETQSWGYRKCFRIGFIWVLCAALLSVGLPMAIQGRDLKSLSLINLFHKEAKAPKSKIAVENNAEYRYTVNDYSMATIDSYTGGETDLTLPLMVDGHIVVGMSRMAFSGCRQLVSLTVPRSYSNINVAAFAGCLSLKTVTIREGVTSVQSLAFNLCPSLREVWLPESLERIADDAFPEDCKATFHVVRRSVADDFCVGKGYNIVYVDDETA